MLTQPLLRKCALSHPEGTIDTASTYMATTNMYQINTFHVV